MSFPSCESMTPNAKSKVSISKTTSFASSKKYSKFGKHFQFQLSMKKFDPF
jgi:hypothetical protein